MTDTNTLAPTDDLQKRCAEIIGWYRTGVLVGDTLRSHAESKWPGDIHNLQMAERATENEALCFIAKWGATAPASQPFAYEFSRSNGDGTHSEHIERGRLQEVAPGRWEHSGLPRGALADKPIKALYTTPQTQPVAVPASGPVGFDHKTAANFLNGKTVTDEEVRQFVAHSRWAHDDRDWFRNTIADLRREIAQRDAEIALLKTSLLDAESPTQAAHGITAQQGGAPQPADQPAPVAWRYHCEGDPVKWHFSDTPSLLGLTQPLYASAQPAVQALDAQRLTKASRYISTVLRVEGVDLEIGSRRLLREARDAIDAAIAAQQGGQ